MSLIRLAIIGASSLGRQISGHAQATGLYEVVGYFDDFAAKSSEVFGGTSSINSCFEDGAFDCLSVGVGYHTMSFRHKIFTELRGRIPFAKIFHSSSLLDSSAKAEEGVVMLANAVVDQRTEIGANCFISIATTISHDSVIGESAYLAPRTTVCGNCRVGNRVFLGAGCVIKDGIQICDDAIVGAGAVVVKDINVPGVYVGNPAKMIKGITS